MKQYARFLTYSVFIILLVLVGCNDDDDIISTDILMAVAGEDRLAKVNDEILLDGSASHSKDDGLFNYYWSIIAKPANSLAVLDNLTDAKPTFEPDKAGVYRIQLRINRNNLSDTDEIKITVTDNDQEGPATIILNEDISENTTLADIFDDPEQPDYRVTADIAVRADLVIMPGVSVVFEENTGLEILSGSILARGLADKIITFKGITDQPGFWKGIVIHTNSNHNELEYVKIQHGGQSPFEPSNTKANLLLAGSAISGAALKVSHSSFSESGGYGLYLQGMSSLNHFSKNRFENNILAAVYIPAGQLHELDTDSFIDNHSNVQIIETGGPVLSGGELNWKKLSYWVSSDITVSTGITIDAGAHFRFEDGISVSVVNTGYLHAEGTEASRIIFTAIDPNTYWNGLYFNSYSQQNIIRFSNISNGGRSRIADADQEGNIVVGQNGLLKIENSAIKDGLGYGIVSKTIGSINTDVHVVNTFINLQKGSVFPAPTEDLPPIDGVWLDRWSFNHSKDEIGSSLYDKNSGTWFAGAANPWAMQNASFGIHIEEDGRFTWTIAEHSPMTGCESYSAEFITGQASIATGTITFQQDYWRSKFVNKCDETQNVDTEVTPTEFVLPYAITKMYDVLTGEKYWELKLTNPDNTTFSYYRR